MDRRHRHRGLAVLVTLAAGAAWAADPAPAATVAATAPATATGAAVADPPPLRRLLIDDAANANTLARLVKLEPAATDDGHDAWLLLILDHAYRARDYDRAEACTRALMARQPQFWYWYDELSVVLGKQGKYQAALDAANAAAAMPASDHLHLDAISASWLWHLGRRDEARARFAAIPEPAQGTDPYEMYEACRACFAASTHDLPALTAAVRILVVGGGNHTLDFLHHDVIFDQYRGEKWFRDLVGETLAPVE
jgi:tetratricopeptide (TPR) repeat protein